MGVASKRGLQGKCVRGVGGESEAEHALSQLHGLLEGSDPLASSAGLGDPSLRHGFIDKLLRFVYFELLTARSSEAGQIFPTSCVCAALKETYVVD